MCVILFISTYCFTEHRVGRRFGTGDAAMRQRVDREEVGHVWELPRHMISGSGEGDDYGLLYSHVLVTLVRI